MEQSTNTNNLQNYQTSNFVNYQTSTWILKQTIDRIKSDIIEFPEYSNIRYNESDLYICQKILGVCNDGLQEHKERIGNDWHKSAWILQQIIYLCQDIILNYTGYQQSESPVLEFYNQLMTIISQGLNKSTYINSPLIVNESVIENDQESVIGDDQESVIGDDQESVIGDDQESVIGDDQESVIGDDQVAQADQESVIDEWEAGWENGWENGWKSAMKLVRNYTTSRRTAPSPPSCTNCGIYCNLKKCGGSCKGMVSYCSTICQKDHWKQTHKYSCVCLNN